MVWEVRTELNTELFQALTFFWGSLAFHSSYLSASNSSCRTQWRPQMLGHIVPGMYVLPHPAQRNRASSGQPQGTCSVPLPPPYKEYPRIGLYLASPHSDATCPSLPPSCLYRRAAVLPTLQIGDCLQFLSDVS